MPRIDQYCRNFSLRAVGTPAMFLGVVDITLPTRAAKVIAMSGAGIAGEYEAVAGGHYSAMSTTINLHTPTTEQHNLVLPNQSLEARGEIRSVDSITGEETSHKLVFHMRGTAKSDALGKLEVANKMDSNIEFALRRLVVEYDDQEAFAWDAAAYLCRVWGNDLLEQSRSILGFV